MCYGPKCNCPDASVFQKCPRLSSRRERTYKILLVRSKQVLAMLLTERQSSHTSTSGTEPLHMRPVSLDNCIFRSTKSTWSLLLTERTNFPSRPHTLPCCTRR